MTSRFLAPAAAVALALAAAAPADAQSCAAGSPAGHARVNAPDNVGRLVAMNQYAWNGADGIVEVCSLTGNLISTGYWDIYTGEVSGSHPGICISITTASGQRLFSCATGSAVQRAFRARSEPRDVLRFFQWQPGLAANITR